MRSSAKFIGLAAVSTAALCAPACGGESRDYGAATGGSSASGGKSANGGKSASGGKSGGTTSAGEGGEQSQAGTSAGGTAGSTGTLGGAGGVGGEPGETGGSDFGGTTALAGAGGVSEPGSSGAGGAGGTASVVPAPDTRITSTPPNPDNVATPTFQFTSSIANSTFQCKFDTGAYATCTSPRTLTLREDGTHTFSVYAVADGVADRTPATYTWTFDTLPPTVTITAKPAAVTSSTTANFTFSAETDATVACSLDGAAFGACTSTTTHSVIRLATGTHTFAVRATDAANNTATATTSWYIEPPCVPLIIEAEDFAPVTGWAVASGNVLHNLKALSDTSINAPFSFTFQGKGLTIYNEKGSNLGKHTVTIDGGAPFTVTATDPSGFSFQNPTSVATGLLNAVHTATVVCIQSNCEIDYFSVTCE